jgi:hypothetical protein
MKPADAIMLRTHHTTLHKKYGKYKEYSTLLI